MRTVTSCACVLRAQSIGVDSSVKSECFFTKSRRHGMNNTAILVIFVNPCERDRFDKSSLREKLSTSYFDSLKRFHNSQNRLKKQIRLGIERHGYAVFFTW